MFSRDFKIWGTALIGLTLLFFIYPVIAAFIGGLGIGVLFAFLLKRALVVGEIGGNRGGIKFSFDRYRQPVGFWFVFAVYSAVAVVYVVMLVFACIEHPEHLLVHYF